MRTINCAQATKSEHTEIWITVYISRMKLVWSLPSALLEDCKPSVCSVLVFSQPFLKWRGRVGCVGVRGWNIGLHCWRLRPTLLCGKEESKKRVGKEGTLERECEVTEFICSIGSKPTTCLWVSVAVPVHVFSPSPGRPLSLQSGCQRSLIVLVLSSWLRFFVLCRSCDCLQTCFLTSQGNLSEHDSHQRGFCVGRFISPRLSLSGLFFWPFILNSTHYVNTAIVS